MSTDRNSIAHISECLRAGLNVRITRQAEIKFFMDRKGIHSFPGGTTFKITRIEDSTDVELKMETKP